MPAELAGNNALVVKRGADALGWSGDFIYRNAQGLRGLRRVRLRLPDAAPSSTSGVTYVPARVGGGRHHLHRRARASRIVIEGGRARGVEATTAGGGTLRVECDTVIVACGAIHTPLLLRRNGLGGDVRASSARTSRSTRPPRVRALFDEEIDMARGVPQSYYIDEFADEGIMFEGAAGPPDYLAMSFPFTRERHRELMLQLPQPRPVRRDGLRPLARHRCASAPGRVEIRYDLCDEDVATVPARRSSCCAQLFREAGAKEVFLPIDGAARTRPAAGAECARLTLMAFHPLGTARADARPAHGVVDGDLKLHGVEGVYVCRRERGAELARREPADHDHGPGHAAGVPPARAGAARGRAGAGVDRAAADHRRALSRGLSPGTRRHAEGQRSSLPRGRRYGYVIAARQ